MSDRTNPWRVLLGCFLLSVGVNAFIIAPSSITPLYIERFDITQAAAGNMVSAPILGIILTQIPVGYLLDRYDNRRLMAAAIGIYMLIVLGIQLVGLFRPFLGLRFLGGVVAGFVQTTGVNIVGQVFPTDRQGFATGVYFASPPVAFAFAHATSPPVGVAFGPSRVFLLHGAIAVLGLAVFLVAATGPLRSAGTPTTVDFVSALRNRSVILVGLSAFAAFSLNIFLNTWLPTYGREVHSLSLGAAGIVTAVVPLVGILARPAGGWFSGYLGNRRRPVLAAGLVVGLLLMVLIPLGSDFLVFVALLIAAGFAIQLGIGLYHAFARELAAAGTEGMSLTVLTTIAFAGSFVAPSAGGWLITIYSWEAAFAAFAVVGIGGAVALLPVSEPARGTPAAMER